MRGLSGGFAWRRDTVVASAARLSGGGIAEISKNETTPTTARVRVRLHRVELRQVGATRGIECLPVDRERGEWAATIANPIALAESGPCHELITLQSVEQRSRCARTAERGRNRGKIERDAVVQSVAADDSPQRPQELALGCTVAGQLALDPFGRSKQADLDVTLGTLVRLQGARDRQNPQCRLDLPIVDLAGETFGDDCGIEISARIDLESAFEDTLDQRARGIRALDEELVREPVLERVQEKNVRGLSVASRAPGLLIVALERPRHGVVNDDSDVRLVDTHTEGVRRHDDAHLFAHERVLDLVTSRVIQTGVIHGDGDARALQRLSDALPVAPRGRIDDRHARPALQDVDERRVLRLVVLSGHDVIVQIATIEASAERLRVLQAELPGYVAADMLSRRGRQGDDGRTPKLFAHVRAPQVARA